MREFWVTSTITGDRNSIARLNADGSLDTGFQNGMDGVINAYGYSGKK